MAIAWSGLKMASTYLVLFGKWFDLDGDLRDG